MSHHIRPTAFLGILATILVWSTIVPAIAQVTAPPGQRIDISTDQIIESMMSAIKHTKKPLPGFAVDIAMRAYQTWKTYKNGEKVEDVQREVIGVLTVVAGIKDEVEAGREMTAREYRLIRELLDVHQRRLDDLTTRLATLEITTKQTAASVAAYRKRAEDLEIRFRRPSCGRLHAWRGRRCVDVAVNPR
jgi:hypothetical protein